LIELRWSRNICFSSFLIFLVLEWKYECRIKISLRLHARSCIFPRLQTSCDTHYSYHPNNGVYYKIWLAIFGNAQWTLHSYVIIANPNKIHFRIMDTLFLMTFPTNLYNFVPHTAMIYLSFKKRFQKGFEFQLCCMIIVYTWAIFFARVVFWRSRKKFY
jgi:hypothetical protein